MKAWRSDPPDPTTGPAIALQFGHAREGVEMRLATDPLLNQQEVLQFGHAREGVEMSCGRTRWREPGHCFNSATPVKAWRSDAQGSVRGQHRGFNSATPVKAWRFASRPHRLGPPATLQFGHAREGVEISHSMTGRKAQDAKLQFGHAREGVEIRMIVARRSGASRHASIRPRP